MVYKNLLSLPTSDQRPTMLSQNCCVPGGEASDTRFTDLAFGLTGSGIEPSTYLARRWTLDQYDILSVDDLLVQFSSVQFYL